MNSILTVPGKKSAPKRATGRLAYCSLKQCVHIESVPGLSPLSLPPVPPWDFVSSVSPLLTGITSRCCANSSLIEIHNRRNLSCTRARVVTRQRERKRGMLLPVRGRPARVALIFRSIDIVSERAAPRKTSRPLHSSSGRPLVPPPFEFFLSFSLLFYNIFQDVRSILARTTSVRSHPPIVDGARR